MMRALRLLPVPLILGLALTPVDVSAQAAQPGQRTAPSPDPIDPINWECPIGSFKILDANGRTEFSFVGTVMVAGHEGAPIRVTGNVRTEWEDKRMKRIAYFGRGRIVVEGKWRAIQVFGRELKGRFEGYGFMRVVGEFDKNLNTGWYWFDSEPSKRNIWYTNSITLQVPPPRTAPAAPRRRGS